MTNLTRETKFVGAYDWRGTPDYGIHCMDLLFSVKGPKGAIEIIIFTRWFLPDQQASSQKMYASGYPWDEGELCRPNFAYINYHSKEPMYEEQEAASENCILTDGRCYSDGSCSWGDEYWREGFLHGGSDWLFSKMEDEYRHRFENGPQVDLTPTPRPHPKDKN